LPGQVVSQGFGRDRRLLSSQQFQAVFDSPTHKASGKHLLLLAHANGLDHSRLGLVIGKKSVKLSVERNRIKRVIRDSFRLNQDRLGSFDLVFVARKGLGEVDNPELHDQLLQLWKRLNRQASKAVAHPIDSPDGAHA
jgi:ribonuclease P protein component